MQHWWKTRDYLVCSFCGNYQPCNG
ncbi:hypothetical protein ACM55F_16120 [Flavobacterium sp. XS2P12]